MPQAITKNCAWCGKEFIDKSSNHIGRYCRKLCRTKDNPIQLAARRKGLKKATLKKTRPYREHLVPLCALCGFVPQDLCQMDVDHIDYNHNNNDPSNLQSLCANCHRLKTKRDQEINPSPNKIIPNAR